MINAVYDEMPLIFIGGVSDTILDMISVVHHDKPFIFIEYSQACAQLYEVRVFLH